MYTGASTEEPPIATPIRNRNTINDVRSHASAQPRAATRYSRPTNFSTSREPNLSPGRPIVSAPNSVPHSAVDTAIPRPAAESEKASRRSCVTPEITAVSKPNSSPARLATMMIRSCDRASIALPDIAPILRPAFAQLRRTLIDPLP